MKEIDLIGAGEEEEEELKLGQILPGVDLRIYLDRGIGITKEAI